jgi:hypothetical protein
MPLIKEPFQVVGRYPITGFAWIDINKYFQEALAVSGSVPTRMNMKNGTREAWVHIFLSSFFFRTKTKWHQMHPGYICRQCFAKPDCGRSTEFGQDSMNPLMIFVMFSTITMHRSFAWKVAHVLCVVNYLGAEKFHIFGCREPKWTLVKYNQPPPLTCPEAPEYPALPHRAVQVCYSF